MLAGPRLVLVAAAFFCVFIFAAHHARAANYALQFDGVNDYVNVGNSTNLNLTDNFEIALWLKASSTQLGHLIGRVGTNGDILWQIMVETGARAGAVVATLYDGTLVSDIHSDVPITDNKWQHVIWTRSGDQQTILVDGVNKTQIDHLDPGIGNVNDTTNVYIGGDVESGGFYFSGAIDQIVVKIDGAIRGVWGFDAGSGATAADESGFGNTGTISGATWTDGAPPLVVASQPSSVGAASLPTGYRPEARILSPIAGEGFGEKVVIRYEATDRNDAEGPANFGLGSDAVALWFSSDGGLNWQPLARGLTPAGTHDWNTKDIPEGEYVLKIQAEDRSGEYAEATSSIFFIDRSGPTFDVSVEPPYAKKENIIITIEANEPLLQSPDVLVHQRNYTDIAVFASGASTTWRGEYEVRSGADGTAKISVSGKDLAGNVGTVIQRGGFFNVGLKPPPTPVILEPRDGDITATSAITIRGSIREDTFAAVFMNGVKVATATPDAAGLFTVSDVPIATTTARGVNVFQVFSEDVGGNLSEPAVLTVRYNLPPSLTIVSPAEGDIFYATTTIQIVAHDENDDAVRFHYEYQPADSGTWRTIAEDAAESLYEWDTRAIPDGAYILRVTADDGHEAVMATSSQFFIRNFQPAVSFASEEILTNQKQIEISGIAASPHRARGRASTTIAGVEYSVDGGVTWHPARASDGAFDEANEEFVLTLSYINEGAQEILARSRDSRGLFGNGHVMVRGDFTPPAVPVVTAPAHGAVFGDRDDGDPDVSGAQVEIRGVSEPLSRVVLVRALGTPPSGFEATADTDGKFVLPITLIEHGDNLFDIVAYDAAGNVSALTGHITLVYNNPPVITFLRPADNTFIGGAYEVAFEIQDPDLDRVRSARIAYREQGSAQSIPLGDVAGTSTFVWDLRGLRDGPHELTLEASDGVSSASVSRRVTVDNTPPAVKFAPLEKNAFTGVFTLEMRGSATDDLSGVQYVEYRIASAGQPVLSSLRGAAATKQSTGSSDDEWIAASSRSGTPRNDAGNVRSDERDVYSANVGTRGLNEWFRATITSGYKTHAAAFRVRHPFELPDGAYAVDFRATDVAGNISKVGEAQEIIVDTTPPRIGSYTISSGAFLLYPEGDAFRFVEGGRATLSISLEHDTASATVALCSNRHESPVASCSVWSLTALSGLWRSDIAFEKSGEYALLISASDALENKAENRVIGGVTVSAPGRVVSESGNVLIDGAEINIELFRPEDQTWTRWQAEAYGLANPILTKNSGLYEMLLPAGRYRLRLKKRGYQRLATSPFEVVNPLFIHSDFTMQPRKGIRGWIEDWMER